MCNLLFNDCSNIEFLYLKDYCLKHKIIFIIYHFRDFTAMFLKHLFYIYVYFICVALLIFFYNFANTNSSFFTSLFCTDATSHFFNTLFASARSSSNSLDVTSNFDFAKSLIARFWTIS